MEKKSTRNKCNSLPFQGKYQLTYLDRTASAGKKAVLTSGISFCKHMIKDSIDVFKKVVNSSFDDLDPSDSEDENNAVEFSDDEFDNDEVSDDAEM
jgi:hypothetical protein